MLKINTGTKHADPLSEPAPNMGPKCSKSVLGLPSLSHWSRKCSKSLLEPASLSHFLCLGQTGSEPLPLPVPARGRKCPKISTGTSHSEPLSRSWPDKKSRKSSKSVLELTILSHFLGLGQLGAENVQNQYWN